MHQFDTIKKTRMKNDEKNTFYDKRAMSNRFVVPERNFPNTIVCKVILEPQVTLSKLT